MAGSSCSSPRSFSTSRTTRPGSSATRWRRVPRRSSSMLSSTRASGSAWIRFAISACSRTFGTPAPRRGCTIRLECKPFNTTLMYDYAIVGGGIVGLSVGMHLTERFPDARVLLLEKEDHWAAHQTGHNSGVIHSGIYYKPGSYKAKFAVEGSQLMVEFCQEHGITHDVCGKIIVATDEWELPLLDSLLQRGLANGLAVQKIGPEQIREIEPHCRGIAAIRVPSTGIADYKA